MLRIKRRKGQTLAIGRAVVEIISIKGGSVVEIGIRAPREIEVDRGEVIERRRREIVA